MATTKKVLGQSKPAAATMTTIYTAPGSTMTTCSTLRACNHSLTTIDLIRVSVRIAGAGDTAAQYLVRDMPLGPNDAFAWTEGWTLGAADKVDVYSLNGTSSFNLFGMEET